jgi:hypothetical protein
MATVVDAEVSVEAGVVAMEAATTTEGTEEAATSTTKTVAVATVGEIDPHVKYVANLVMEPLNAGIDMKRTTKLKKK